MRRWRRGSHRPCGDHGEDRLESRFDETIDEILELAWILEEEGNNSAETLAARAGVGCEDRLDTARTAHLIDIRDGQFILPPEGRARAKEIIRRHRLTEVLLMQVLEMEEPQVEWDACRFEHILSQEATESVCTLLGHPPTCPHGKPIPRGACCERFRKELTPLVTPIAELNPGDEARIVFITPRSHALLDRLASLGIVPGSRIRLHQKRPTCVIQIGETDIAIDAEVARQVFVKQI